MAIASTLTMNVTATTEIDSAEAALIAAVQRGDADAFGQLVRQHQHRVFRLAGRFFRRPEDVEEVAQETFLTAWRRFETYRSLAPFEHWLTRICLNCCYDRLRARPQSHEPVALDTEREVTAPDQAVEARIEVAQLLAQLPAKDRFMLILLEVEGWSVAEVAERLGWTAVNVKVRAHRARRRLRQVLEEGL